MVLEELLPPARHRTEQHANNRVETDHDRLKSRLRPMRCLKQQTGLGDLTRDRCYDFSAPRIDQM